MVGRDIPGVKLYITADIGHLFGYILVTRGAGMQRFLDCRYSASYFRLVTCLRPHQKLGSQVWWWHMTLSSRIAWATCQLRQPLPIWFLVSVVLGYPLGSFPSWVSFEPERSERWVNFQYFGSLRIIKEKLFLFLKLRSLVPCVHSIWAQLKGSTSLLGSRQCWLWSSTDNHVFSGTVNSCLAGFVDSGVGTICWFHLELLGVACDLSDISSHRG